MFNTLLILILSKIPCLGNAVTYNGIGLSISVNVSNKDNPPTDMHIGQPDLENPSLRLSSLMIQDCSMIIVETNHWSLAHGFRGLVYHDREDIVNRELLNSWPPGVSTSVAGRYTSMDPVLPLRPHLPQFYHLSSVYSNFKFIVRPAPLWYDYLWKCSSIIS